MKLYSVHCGFYDSESGYGVYESHVNLFVVAKDSSDAKLRAKAHPGFMLKKMHIDGLQELDAIDGYRVILEQDHSLEGKSRVSHIGYQELSTRLGSQE